MGDLYAYASGSVFGLTFCVPLYEYGEYYGAVCYDIKITQYPMPF